MNPGMLLTQLKALIKRDLTLLSRSKSSSAAILLGPLLVILIVGVVFATTGQQHPHVGVIPGGFADAQSYQDSLAESFVLKPYQSEDECVRGVKQGVVAACVAFGQQDPTARIHVDPTDVSVVYAIIDRVTGALDERSGELRSGLTSTLLSAVSKTGSSLSEDKKRLQEVIDALEQQQADVDRLSAGLGQVRVDAQLVGSSQVEDAIDDTLAAQDEYERLARAVQADYLSLAEDHSDNQSIEDAERYEDEIDNVTEPGTAVFDDLLSSLDEVSSEISQSRSRSDELAGSASRIQESLGDAQEGATRVFSSLSSSQQLLAGIDISESDITSPIQTEVLEVSSQDDSFSSVLPHFLALLVMFTALLLSSQLVVGERQSRAYFRNFTTPTKDWAFVLATYASTLLVVLAQLVLLFLVVGAFTGINVLSNFGANFLVLFAIVSFFAFLGMLLGYVVKTQEGVMLSAISLSSVFLLVSGLVLPVQTLPGLVRFLVKANPFVISADLLTGSLVFGFGVGELLTYFLVLVIYAAMLFFFIMITQRVARLKYFESAKTAFHVSAFLGESEIPEGKELHLGERTIASKRDLLLALRELSDDEYEQFADHHRNLFADWVRDVYKDDRLARALRNTSRRGAIAVLEKEVS